MKKAIVFLANGFEEMEATGTVDILRRGGIDTKTVSITDDRKVVGAHHMEYSRCPTFRDRPFGYRRLDLTGRHARSIQSKRV